jgi:ketosteroid isomerase-like protein
MSQENVEVARRFNSSAASKAEMLAALPTMVALCGPEVEWTQRGARETSRGREGVREALEQWLDSFEDYSFEAQRIVDCGGDHVLVVGLEVGTGVMSGAEVRSLNYELLTIRDGLIVRYREFYDEREALEAAGLSE